MKNIQAFKVGKIISASSHSIGKVTYCKNYFAAQNKLVKLATFEKLELTPIQKFTL
jgi:hypothetical protein